MGLLDQMAGALAGGHLVRLDADEEGAGGAGGRDFAIDDQGGRSVRSAGAESTRASLARGGRADSFAAEP